MAIQLTQEGKGFCVQTCETGDWVRQSPNGFDFANEENALSYVKRQVVMPLALKGKVNRFNCEKLYRVIKTV